MVRQKILVAVAGPTAVGKTAVAISLARHFNSVILSFDSRQCYRELNIGVARPSIAELESVPHFFIASHSIHDAVNAAAYEQYALQKLEQLFAKHDVIIAVGGTGLYLKALCDGLDTMPKTNPMVREQLRSQFEKEGLPWLQKTIAEEDPSFALTGDTNNPHRMLRALEVLRSSGMSIRKFQTQQKAARFFEVIKIGLELPKPVLNEAIHQRVLQMMEDGQLDEATELYPHRHLQPLQTVGYSELFEYLVGEISFPKALEKIITHTRQYAKRQLTWFRKDAEIHWFSPRQGGNILKWTTHRVKAIQTSLQK